MRQREVYIATPCMTGEVWVGYLKSIMSTLMLFTQKGIKTHHDSMSSNSLIPLARNLLVQDFLESTANTFLFIDADLSWQAEAALRLVESPHDVIGGAYPCKDDEMRWAGLWRKGQTRLLEADGVTGGFMKVSRRAFEQMAPKFPELKARYGGREFTAFFDTGIFDGEYLGEDYAFTRRWQMCGGKAFIDPDITFGHYGHKCWEANLQTVMKAEKARAA